MKNAAIVLAILFAAADAVPYSKYGRSCKDIGCRSDEVCVIAEEPCSYGHQRDQCGRYPTCQRSNSGASESCTTKICPSGQYCTTKNGRPTCVNTNAGLDEDKSNQREKAQEQGNSDTKPSAPQLDNNGHPNSSQVKDTRQPAASYPNYPSSGNSGYPGYPESNQAKSTPQSSADRFGYPVQSKAVASYPGYPSSNHNYGYPGYPTQDPTRRTSAIVNDARYPSQSAYPAPNASSNPYYGGGYRPQQQQGPYQGGYFPAQQNGYPNQAYNPYNNEPPTTKKPSFTDKIANYAKNLAKQVLTQAIVDKVSGRS